MARINKDIIKMARDEDLALSGLNKPAIKKKLGLTTLLNEAETLDVTGVEGAIAYEIPYFSVTGEKLKHRRWKIISLGEDLGLKYYQQPKTIPRLYFPPLLDWAEIAADASQRIVITEGEKKAAKACLDGIPCFGLGGVWNWKSKKWAMPEIKDFDEIDWKGREVEVCYDADLSENENVAKALAALCSTLGRKGARVFIRYLPSIEGADSLDEFLVKHGVDGYTDLECEEAAFSRELTRFNEQLVYVEEMIGYYAVETGVFYPNIQKLLQAYGHIKVIGESGKPNSAIKEWAEWPHMRRVKRLAYDPGATRFADGCFNIWTGFGLEPQRGECGRFLNVVKQVDNWEWLLQWLAWPLQHPGAKMYTATLLWSPETGTGKSFIGGVMQDIYGRDNTSTITSVDLHDDRLSWLRNTQFILGEEVSSANQRGDTGVLKHIITGETVRVNEKYQPAYNLPNRANFMFNSNYPDALRIERDDRRFWVGRLNGAREQGYWDDLDKWRKNGGGSAFMWYLQNQVDCSSFNPRARAPQTEDKKEMVYMGLSSMEQWITDLMECDDNFFGDVGGALKGIDVFTVEQLMIFMSPELDRMRPAPSAVGKALTNANAPKYGRGGVIKVKGKAMRLYAIRNQDFWRQHINSEPGMWAANKLGKMSVLNNKARYSK